MKKSLIALAALAASTAFAQSSVTMYGKLDANVSDAGNKIAGGMNVNAIDGASTMQNGSSRIGWRGVEDLGNGLKAGFNYELGFNSANGNLSTTNTRASNMWLGSDTMGTFMMGRALTLGFGVNNLSDVTGSANYSAQANAFGFTGGARNSGEYRYTSPNFSGFQVGVGAAARANTGTPKHKFDVAAWYANGPLAVGAAVSNAGELKGSGQNMDWAINGAYDFGAAKVALGYMDNRAGGSNRGFTVGASAPLGAVTLSAQYARITDNVVPNRNVFSLEGKYALSKRTFAYAAFLKSPQNWNGWGVGLNHSF